MRSVVPSGAFCRQEGPDAVEFEIVVGPVSRVGHEKLAAAVLPDRSVVLKRTSPQVQAPDMVEHGYVCAAPCDAESHVRHIGIFIRPVDRVDISFGTPCLHCKVQLIVIQGFKAFDERYFQCFHIFRYIYYSVHDIFTIPSTVYLLFRTQVREPACR